MELKPNILYVDNREPQKIFKVLDKKEIPYEKTQLPVGDFVYNDMVFERKSMPDFYISIQGRLWEQVSQMKDNFNNVFVLISGKFQDLYFGKIKYNSNIIYGAISALMIKCNVHVCRLENDNQLIELINKICKKSHDTKSFSINRKKPKKDEIQSYMVASIPGIGINKAKILLSKYSLKQLFYEVSVEDIAKIEGFGVKTAEKIKAFLS